NHLLPLILPPMMLMAACDENTSQTGSSLVEGETQIINQEDFTVNGASAPNSSVRSRTVLQLLGRLSAEGYGDISSDIVCQYMPAANVDTFDVSRDDIDSVKLVLTMYKGGFAGDSVVPMGLSVHRLTRQLKSPLYSDFNPEGYYDPTPIGSTVYSALLAGSPDVGTDSEGSIFKDIYVDLPLSIGRDLYDLYVDNSAVLSTPQSFAQWFPGLYITTTFGSGRVTRISNNAINVYYHITRHIDDEENPRDTVIAYVGSYMGVTPEVLTNNNITYKMAPELSAKVQAGESLLVGPLGYEAEFTFPAREILDRYKAQAGELAIINSLTFSLPASEIANDYGINPPPYVLMVKKSEKEKFFSRVSVNDNVSSFYAAYDSTNKCYNFSSMLAYINDIIKQGEVKPEDEEFVICPVNISYYASGSSSSYYDYYYYGYTSTSQQISAITPYVTEPVMV
ncbi:MAG: DUF4270 domain-containing protein, partial [Duncaniella sp.]|nr:DUF4270 domain-containing protein [Duncaniella sp.]